MARWILLLVIMLAVPGSPARGQEIYRGVTAGPQLSLHDIAEMADWGVNLVRIPLTRSERAHLETEAEYYARLREGMRRLETMLPVFLIFRIKVVIELGSPPGGFASESGKPQHRLFQERWAQDAFITGWNMIAKRYADSPVIWGYDILNEPAQNKVLNGARDWNELARETALAIRSVDTRHKVIVETVYGNPVLIRKLKRIDLPNIVYSAHMYYTLRFQHQGLYGNPLGVHYPQKKLNKKALVTHLRPVLQFARRNNAEIYIGEFSAVRWAPGSSAYNYLMDALDIFENYGWHYTYHAFREADSWSVEHGNTYMDPTPALRTTDREMLLRQYFRRNR